MVRHKTGRDAADISIQASALIAGQHDAKCSDEALHEPRLLALGSPSPRGDCSLKGSCHRLHLALVGRTRNPLAAALSLLAAGLYLPSSVHAQAVSPPPVKVLHNSGPLADGFIFIGPQDIDAPNPVQGPEIIDNLGRIVWFKPTPGNVATNFRVQSFQGKPVLTWSQGVTFGDTKAGDTTDYIMDGSYNIVATVQAGHGYNTDVHEFQITPQNTALISIYDNVQADLTSVGGPSNGTVTEGAVQEIDIPTGNVLFEWHSLTDVPITESYLQVPSVSSGLPYDYFHINSVKLDTDGNLLISARFTCTVYKVNRTTGAIIWRLGGRKSDFALGPGVRFAFQHDATAVDGATLRIFDNQSDGSVMLPYSRVIWVTHDDAAMTATLAHSIVHPDQVSAAAEGGAQSLPNGDTFVDWGIAGRISEFNSAGQLLFDASEAPGYGSYRGFRFQWTGSPSTNPDATAFQNADGTISVHATWNGATQVSSWQVLGGAVSGALSAIGTVPWNGVDTVFTAPAGINSVQVIALDSTGATIGTSAPASGPFSAIFATQPASRDVASGGSAVFTAVTSLPASTYQWLLNGTPLENGAMNGATISGATGSTLRVSGATAANAGSYSCVASSLGNSVTSSPATLTVSTTTDPGRLVDVSCRSEVETGNGVLIIGYVVGGIGTTGSDPVLLRASGPSLVHFGVSGALPDPVLALFSSSGMVASNSGWAGNPLIASTAAAVGAFAWNSATSLDSALYETLAAGPFTAVIAGSIGDTGIALGEVYDAAPAGSRGPTTPRLVNVSGRARVGAGGNLLIAGFVIGGTTSETVLIRASGPALSKLGVSDTLADPLLQLYQSNGDGTSTLLAANAGWNADAAIAAASASVGAFSWGTSATADSALLVTLPPGAYTAEVSGASGDTGVSLVEIYEVP